MATIQRQAKATWKGSIAEGGGKLELTSSGLAALPFSLPSRIADPEGKTSPEELLAAAHSGCYAMALSYALSQNGTQPGSLTVEATCHMDKSESGFKITEIALHVTGEVSGLDQASFERVAREAEHHCPVSNVLRNNVAIQLNVSQLTYA